MDGMDSDSLFEEIEEFLGHVSIENPIRDLEVPAYHHGIDPPNDDSWQWIRCDNMQGEVFWVPTRKLK